MWITSNQHNLAIALINNTQILNRVTKKTSNGITYLGDEFENMQKLN